MSGQGWDDDDPGWADDGFEDEPFEDERFDDGPAAAAPGDGGGPGRALLVALAIVVVLVVGAIAAIAAGGGDDDGDDTAGGTTSTSSLGLPGAPGRSTTTTRADSSTTSTTVGAPGSSTTSTTRSGTPGPTSSTTIPDGPKEPACSPLGGGGAPVPATSWEGRWTSKPNPNDPATLSFCVDDRTPKVGQVVTLTAHAADPDAPIPDDECAVFVAWTGDDGNLCYDTLTVGPKPLPAEQAGDVVAKRTFVYGPEHVGQRTILVSTTSGNGPDQSPYSSRASTSLGVTVHA